MERLVLIACLLTATSAIFFGSFNLPNRQSMMNVCIYSTDVSQYQPKCFLCPSAVYTNTLTACVGRTSMPSNVSFTQARCIEQNCMISRGKRSVDLTQPDNVLEDYENQVFLEDPKEKKEVSSYEMSPGGAQDKFPIVGTEELFASDSQEEIDYEIEDS